MPWKIMMQMNLESACRQWWSPWSPSVLQVVGVVCIGVLGLAAAARACGWAL